MLEAMTAFEAQRPSGWLHCGEEDGQLMAGLRLPAPGSVRGRCESSVAVSRRPVAAVELLGKQSFNAEVTGTARLYRAASAWISGLDVLPKSM